ncbi:MAG TPA: type II secretion system minor pseudopilin GspJ [Casimicrobiaceae bacterium]|nr:type II secretion system minor pseudopilin GspJ [Casimicrobiaceae bacterium]
MLRCPPRRRSFAPWGGPAALSRLDRGFTLVEALLALAIFGVIAVLAYRATASLSEGEARLSAEAQHWHTLETLFTRFEADIRQAVPRSARVGAAREPAWIGTLYDGQSAVVFTRAGSEFVLEPGPAGQRMGYRLRGDTLELAYWPAIDHTNAATPVVYPLVSGIAAFKLEYLAQSGAWRDRWPLLGEDDVPRAVRLTLTIADGERIERWFALR